MNTECPVERRACKKRRQKTERGIGTSPRCFHEQKKGAFFLCNKIFFSCQTPVYHRDWEGTILTMGDFQGRFRGIRKGDLVPKKAGPPLLAKGMGHGTRKERNTEVADDDGIGSIWRIVFLLRVKPFLRNFFCQRPSTPGTRIPRGSRCPLMARSRPIWAGPRWAVMWGAIIRPTPW